MSRAFETFNANSCINGKTITTKITKASIEKPTIADVIITNQKVKPADTARALKRGEDRSILNRIDE